ncbi:DUF975 family protein [Senegalia massiliensis]|uniref:DUF975 family protein n=1 Tax=Senegalia massiliensis TaxID=1720316 RepID=UPI0010316C6A|nr:DUF975 family protein [Senegalia massiliensis]
MWSRSELKLNAKAVLKKSYWKAFIVSIVIALAGGNNWFSGGGSGGATSGSNEFSNNTNSIPSEIFPEIIFIILFVALSVIAVVMIFRIFLGYPLEVGGKRYFVSSTEYEFNMNYLGYIFEKGIYLDTIKTMLLRGVYNFLWYLLLIIPGIIKGYSYSMVPYILSDNPNIGAKRAIELSQDMTRGHKFDMFILDLSFIGWYLLGVLLFIVGIFFVFPYVNATYAELYKVLREYAIAKNYTTEMELNIDNLIEQ